MRWFLIFTVILVLIAVAYGILRSSSFILGPMIEVYKPLDGEVVGRVFTVEGNVVNARTMTINGMVIYPNVDGDFTTDLSASEGYSVVKLFASNRKGRSATEEVRVFVRH